MKKGIALSLVLLFLISIASGCIGGGEEQTTTTKKPGEGITLIVLTRHDTTIQMLAKEAFLKSDIAKQYNIVNIKFIKAPDSQWPALIKKGADIGWGGGPTLFDDLFKQGYLAPITDEKVLGLLGTQIKEDIAGMPMVRKGDDGKVYWIAAALSSFGFTVNKDVLKRWNLPMPERWEDIASETFALDPPQVGIADPTRSTSNTRIYQIILQAFGWEEGWKVLTIIAANSKIYDASDAVREAVIAGDIAVGNTIDFYGYTAMKLNPSCVYIIPKGESIINGDPIALLKNSQHPEAAQAFIYWVLTEGQKIWLNEDVNRLPVNPAVFDTPEGQKRPDLKKAYELALQTQGIQFDDARALATIYAMQFYFKATLVDANQELHRAWVALVQAYKQGKISKEKYEQLKAQLLAPIQFKDPDTGQMVTFTEEYAKKINERLIKDSGFKDTLMQEWRDAARTKYNKVLAEVQG
ncbi:ABC transporter substrate-binding protein [Thermococcus paralvinellae]|uniref:ABC-type iron(III) transport system, solute-binding protein n=1 Tax=Thermococcus paralvinellae TaxID=582419 RepID=W0I880_9EURY|nr:ABC transporter substrate-binding protein [Thermococcus paralvinellae]AHF80628.1 ABC-type iron(III) transport system, solute-binding protein [Thermococcus paralvinellae]